MTKIKSCEHEENQAEELEDRKNDTPEMRLITVYGEIDEKTAGSTINGLFFLRDTKISDEPAENNIELVLSTAGGNSSDAYALYDCMRIVKNSCDITTIGLGKVMSAGIILLAAGTKGRRLVGANCRLMIHQITAGSEGHPDELVNELSEIKFLQEQYIKCLVAETTTSESKIRALLKKRVNVYFDATEAVKLGIADYII